MSYRLRYHPKLEGQWPPGWYRSGSGTRLLIGEDEATLKQVKLRADRIELVIEYQDNLHTGTLFSASSEFLQVVYHTVKGYLGFPLTRIGDLDIP
jgi:hypothetical protein